MQLPLVRSSTTQPPWVTASFGGFALSLQTLASGTAPAVCFWAKVGEAIRAPNSRTEALTPIITLADFRISPPSFSNGSGGPGCGCVICPGVDPGRSGVYRHFRICEPDVKDTEAGADRKP